MHIPHTFPQTANWILFLCVAFTAACTGDNRSTQQNASADDIHTAVATGNEAVLRQYLAAGKDINVKDPFGGSSPLITAAVFGQPEMAKLLIDAGADLNFRNNEGSTALISAAFFGRREIVQLLLNAGADKTIQNKYGATAYESVAAPFKEVKSTYDMVGKVLAPMGLKLDYPHLEKVRPEIANLLK
ncbi:MAG: ankyrin repeat domain-containing protein [Parapedobacter sp.]|nr:MAG: ankyrin repeat domain-containing protein [Parapedobacter sp.]